MPVSAKTLQPTPIARPFGVGSIASALAGLYGRRHLLWHMTVRHLRSQYKQSVLGYAWIIISPLAQILTLTFIFSIVFRTPSQELPFHLFLAVGLLPWLFFANSILFATDSLSSSASLITGAYFPREIILLSALIVRAIDFLIGLSIVAAMMIYEGQPFNWTLAWVPLIFAIHCLFVIGLSLPLAALNLFFHDVRFLVGVMLQIWFFVTPIFYPIDLVPEDYRFLYDLNPNARIIAAYRYALLGVAPPLESMLFAALIALASFAVGFGAFKKMEPAFADRI